VGTGTVVEVLDHQRLPDGRWAVVPTATTRFRVVEWLADDPYPRARVVRGDLGVRPDDEPAWLRSAERATRRAAALASELGYQVDLGPLEGDTDPVTALWQLVGRSPLGSFDRQRLLEVDGPAERAALLVRLADDLADSLAFRLGNA